MATCVETESRIAGRWTKKEHQKFLYGLKLYGKNWKKIEDLIQTRTSTQIRSHAQKFFIKMKKHSRFEQDTQNHQISNQSKFAQETILSKDEEKVFKGEKAVYSFYFEKVARSFLECQEKGQDFDFWESLVDGCKICKEQSCQELEIEKQIQLKLKKINTYQKPQIYGMKPYYQVIRTQFSSFEMYGQ